MLYAYIDAGSGSMLLQVLLAGMLAVPFFFRRVIIDGWQRIRGSNHDRSQEGSSTDRSE